MKRRSALQILCLVMAFCLFPFHFSALAYEPVPDHLLYVVKNPNPADRLNLRTRPSTTAPSLGRYYNGVRLKMLAPEKNGWIHVEVEGTNVQGYMQTAYLVYNPATPVPYAVPRAKINSKDSRGSWLRSTPSSKDTAIHDWMSNGTEVAILGWGEVWHHVRIENLSGYMPAADLSFAKNPPVQPIQPMPTPLPAPLPDGIQPAIAHAVVVNPNPKDRLNLRDSVAPNGQGGFSIGKYYSGMEVEIMDYVYQGNTAWVSVRVWPGEIYGFMLTDFLAINPPPSDLVGVNAMPTVVVNNPKATDHLHLREKPSASAASLGRYTNGTRVTVMGVMNDTWSHVKVDGVMGFMMNQYLKPRPSFQ